MFPAMRRRSFGLWLFLRLLRDALDVGLRARMKTLTSAGRRYRAQLPHYSRLAVYGATPAVSYPGLRTKAAILLLPGSSNDSPTLRAMRSSTCPA